MEAPQASKAVLLTGATGLLGSYLLRNLLQTHTTVAVLVRDQPSASARERIDALVQRWSTEDGVAYRHPHIITADLADPFLDIGLANRHWLFHHQPAVVHCAASLSFRSLDDGEPWKTNYAGTRALAEMARQSGMREWHHISTAFVCGHRHGDITEEELDCNQTFTNPYEESKFAAERFLRRQPNLNLTVYRPSIIVGHHLTGETSTYVGLYKFLEMAARLASQPAKATHFQGPPLRSFPIRLPMSGTEPLNLVPVDWVAEAICSILDQPANHGRTYHLVARKPVTMQLLTTTTVAELGLEGVKLVGRQEKSQTRLEKLFWQGLNDYLPYLQGSPNFLATNTAFALPHLPPPVVNETLLQRLIQYAVANNWGRQPNPVSAVPQQASSFCRYYFEDVFPAQARRSQLAKSVGLEAVVGFRIDGVGGGEWTCRWIAGAFVACEPGLPPQPQTDLLYQLNTVTLEAIVSGQITPQQAFFEQRIALQGDLEMGLKLAYLFELFLQESQGQPSQTEERHARAA